MGDETRSGLLHNLLPEVKKTRVVFIDQARALAVLLMIGGHSMSRFLSEPWRSGPAYTNYQFFRGLSSALFLMVAGFSFVVASFKYFDDYTRWSPRMRGRVNRITLILFLGYTLQIYAPTLTQSIFQYSPDKLERLLKFDVLLNIGYGLMFVHILVFVSRSPERFWKICAAFIFLIFAAAFITYKKEVSEALPVGLATALNMHHQSRFPLVPYTSYMLIGSVFGYFFAKHQRKGDEWKPIVGGVIVALLLWGFEWFIRNKFDGGLFPYSGCRGPGNTFARAACSLLVICALYFVGRYRLVFPRLSFILSKDSLSIYFFHLFILYGNKTMHGAFYTHKEKMNPVQIWLWIATLTLSMILTAWAIGWARDNKPVHLTRLRQCAIAGILITFLAWPGVTVYTILTSCALGTTLVLGTHRFLDRKCKNI
jgi:uncharacterized membrane protein